MSRAIHKMRGGITQIVIVGTVLGNVSSVDGSTHSLGNIDVGGASSDKNVILGITWEEAAIGNRTISSLTVGGVALAVKESATVGGDNDIDAACWAADISSISGVQAISVTFNAGVGSAAVSGVAVSGLQSLTPTMSDDDTTASSAQLSIASLAALVGGIAFACGASSSAGSSPTWGSLTERVDVQTGGAGDDHRHTAAWNLGSHSAANETLDFTAGVTRVAVGLGFR